MLKVTTEYVGEVLTKIIDGLSSMIVVMIPSSDVDPRRDSKGTIQIKIEGLEEEGIKGIDFKLGRSQFEVQIERVDGRITTMEMVGKALNVESGFIFNEKGQRVYNLDGCSSKQFPSVFGR